MKKLLGIVVLGLLFSSNTHAGLFDNKFFPSDRAKSFCVSDVYDGLGGIANENKTDKHKKFYTKNVLDNGMNVGKNDYLIEAHSGHTLGTLNV